MSTSFSVLSKLRPRPVNLLRLLWCLSLLWFELGTFYHHVSQCYWPDHTVRFHDTDVATVTETKATHVLLVADPQILDQGSYPGRDPALMWISQRIVDLNMRRSWRATQTMNPDVIIFLGDLMDRGRFALSDAEYETYYQRFKSIFSMKKDIPVYYIPGNHDIGLGNPSLFSPSSYDRFESHFAPLNQHVNIANHSFVMINAPGLVDEDGHRKLESASYVHWAAAMPGGPIEFIRSQEDNSEIPTILLTHIPLARPEKTDCGPLREKGTIRQGVGFGYQNTLPDDATKFVLESLRPSAIFSGDDHDYCEYWHSVPGINGAKAKEISVKSFSMAMGIKVPGFQLLSLFPPKGTSGQSFFDAPCFLPNQLGIYLTVYVPFIFLSLAALLVSNYYRVKASDQVQRYWASGDAGESGSATNSYLDAGAWRATTPTTMDDSQMLLRKVNEPPSEDEAEEEDGEAYSLPVPGSTTRRTFPRNSRTCSKSWSFVLFGRRRRMTVDSSCLSSSILSPFFYVEGRSPESFRRIRVGFFRGFLRDVFDVAWIAVVLFALIAWWTFL
ncbi:hypothetical protein QCA50_004576 [Cerrena zonata]|uniref:Calcineurin-like phosphoesterase domain-containing protein n=1 Tax=Cerrena zonata TaxID=2478898 RepID=A0AAW0GU86_9APHY